MLYAIAHVIKDKFGFLWELVEWGNASVFAMLHKSQLKQIDLILASISDDYMFRTARVEDTEKLVTFFDNQPRNAFDFFKPHDFDTKSVEHIIKNRAFLTFLVLKDDAIVGYFFLRCFMNGKCFRGKIVHKDWQGRGIAKLMGMAMTKIAKHLGCRMFGSISPDNYASLASAKASNLIKVHKTLENGYHYIEFLPKENDDLTK